MGLAETAASACGAAAVLAVAASTVAEGGWAIRELVNGAPLQTHGPGVGLLELVGLGLLVAAGLVQLAGPGPGAAVTALFGVLLLGATRLSLGLPVFTPTPGGGYTRGPWSLVLLVSVAGVLWALVIACGWIQARQRTRWFAGDLTAAAPGPVHWPGFRPVCGAAGLFVVLLVCYHLGVACDVAGGDARAVALLVACVSGASGVALFTLLRHGRSDGLADLGMGLVSLAVCSAAVMVLPAEPAALSQRYPLIFNAMLVALAVVTWFWAWLGRVWVQQLDGGSAWTVAGGLIQQTGRLSFFSGSLGLAVALLMTIWPRLPVAPGLDDSLGRMAGGVAGHLLLLWAVLWSARRLRRSSFTALAVLTVVSMLGFVYVRWVPLTTAVF